MKIRTGEEIVVTRFWKMENRWTNSNRTSHKRKLNSKLGTGNIRNQPADVLKVQEQIALVMSGMGHGEEKRGN